MKPVAQGHLSTPDGHNPYWADYGPRNATPLLLVHGGGGYIIDPEKLSALDLTKQRVIVLHQRGVGQSLPAGEATNNTVMANIEDMERLRTALNIPQWNILAWSFGTVLAAGYTVAHPGRVKNLVSYAPYLGSDEDYQVLLQTAPALAEKYMDFHQARTGKGIVTSVFNKAAAEDENSRLHAYVTMMELFDDTQTPEELRAYLTDHVWAEVSRTRLISATLDKSLFYEHDRFLEQAVTARGQPIKATLIYGEHDNWSAPNSYARAVFNAVATHTVPGAGHDIHSPLVQKILAKVMQPN